MLVGRARVLTTVLSYAMFLLRNDKHISVCESLYCDTCWMQRAVHGPRHKPSLGRTDDPVAIDDVIITVTKNRIL